MTDLRIAFTPEGTDLELEGGDLAVDRGLVTPILVSLFSNARAQPDDELPDPASSLGGWWGSSEGDPFGSRLWTLRRSTLTEDTLSNARDFTIEALSWLRREGIAAAVRVAAESVEGGLVLEIEIERGTARRWDSLWEGLERQEFESGGVAVEVLPA